MRNFIVIIAAMVALSGCSTNYVNIDNSNTTEGVLYHNSKSCKTDVRITDDGLQTTTLCGIDQDGE